jgi:hypothetical protein
MKLNEYYLIIPIEIKYQIQFPKIAILLITPLTKMRLVSKMHIQRVTMNLSSKVYSK